MSEERDIRASSSLINSPPSVTFLIVKTLSSPFYTVIKTKAKDYTEESKYISGSMGGWRGET